MILCGGHRAWIARAASVVAVMALGGACARQPVPPFSIADFAGTVDDSTAFIVRPYLQLGDVAAVGERDSMVLMWHAAPRTRWTVQLRTADGAPWADARNITARRVAVRGIAPHDVYSALLAGLVPGSAFSYRVLRDSVVVFANTGRARRSAGQPYRFAVFGDNGAGTRAEAEVAYQTYLQKPDFVAIPGDIVYQQGAMQQYRDRFFPYYAARYPSPRAGAPLQRSIPFIAAPGNHDVDAAADLDDNTDALGYFAYWSLPRNGPLTVVNAPNTPPLRGSPANVAATLAAVGASFPRTANYSFDYGNSHWTVLDGDPYVDWTTPALRDWVRRDLQGARGEKWRFVLFHQASVSSARAHAGDQQMRLLSDIFQETGVDVAFTGHVHGYQRSRPVVFARDSRTGSTTRTRSATRVNGTFTVDVGFDGKTVTRPNGIIYIVSGAGGSRLYSVEEGEHPRLWKPFTARFVSDRNSFTIADVRGDSLTVRQLSNTGRELDRVLITRAGQPSTRTIRYIAR